MIKPNYQVLNDIVTVKNAVLIYDYTKELYSLIHHDTEILQVTKDKQIIKALRCSVSSTRAIYQLTDYLGIDRKSFKLKPFTNFVKINNSLMEKELT